MTPEQIMKIVAEALGMFYEDYSKHFKKGGRVEFSEHIDMRTIATILIRSYCPKITLKKIGALFGGMDHTTIMYYRDRGNDLLYTKDHLFIEKYKKVLAYMNPPVINNLHVQLSNVFKNKAS